MKKLWPVLTAAAVLILSAAVYFFVTDIDEGESIIVRYPSQTAAVRIALTDSSGFIELLPGELVNINTDPVSQLKKLPGIGEVLAESIVEYREKNGAFGSIDEIMNVDGIGEGRFMEIRQLIVTGDE